MAEAVVHCVSQHWDSRHLELWCSGDDMGRVAEAKNLYQQGILRGAMEIQ